MYWLMFDFSFVCLLYFFIFIYFFIFLFLLLLDVYFVLFTFHNYTCHTGPFVKISGFPQSRCKATFSHLERLFLATPTLAGCRSGTCWPLRHFSGTCKFILAPQDRFCCCGVWDICQQLNSVQSFFLLTIKKEKRRCHERNHSHWKHSHACAIVFIMSSVFIGLWLSFVKASCLCYSVVCVTLLRKAEALLKHVKGGQTLSLVPLIPLLASNTLSCYDLLANNHLSE